jgi:hypothetical protein
MIASDTWAVFSVTCGGPREPILEEKISLTVVWRKPGTTETN